MKRFPRRTAAALGATAVMALAGCGTTAATQTAAQGGGPAGGGAAATDLETAAAKRDISAAKLKTAMDAIRPTGGQPPSGDPAAALAKQLDLPADKVREAMRSVMQPRAPPQGSPQEGSPPHGTGTPGATTPS